jgi:hyperosmotically inducible periplasmic protein
MNQQSKLRVYVLGTALAATGVFAGTYSALDEPAATPLVIENETVVTVPDATVTTIEPMRSAEPGIIAPTAEPAPVAEPARIAAPARPAPALEPPITITGQRVPVDMRIQAEVMDVLASNDTYTGKVGVESKDRIVTLTGYLMTQGQVWRAARDAGRVQDVRYVVNEIRPRVGTVSY